MLRLKRLLWRIIEGVTFYIADTADLYDGELAAEIFDVFGRANYAAEGNILRLNAEIRKR